MLTQRFIFYISVCNKFLSLLPSPFYLCFSIPIALSELKKSFPANAVTAEKSCYTNTYVESTITMNVRQVRLLKLMELFTKSSGKRTAENRKEKINSYLPKIVFKIYD